MTHPARTALTVHGLAAALRSLGLARGDQVMVHSDLRRFGVVRDEAGRLALALPPAQLYEALREVLGDEGTVVVPTFSYSWTRGEAYNPDTSPSFEGSFSDYVRRLPGAKRSPHPLMSVAALGPAAGALLDGVDETSFDEGSPFGRMHRADTKHLTVGVSVCSFSDYVQWACRVPYRYAKRFRGWVEVDGTRREEVCEHCVRYLDQGVDATPIFDVLDGDPSGRLRRTEVAGVALRLVSSSDLFELMRARLALDPYAFASRPKEDRAIEFLARLLSPAAGLNLTVVATQQEGCERWVWLLPAGLVGLRLSLETTGAAPRSAGWWSEVYLAAARGRSMEVSVSGTELPRHFVERAEEVTGERLRRAGWLLRPVGAGPGVESMGMTYRLRVEVGCCDAGDPISPPGGEPWLAVMPVREGESGARQALRLATERLAGHGADIRERAAELVERLFDEGTVMAVFAQRPRGLPPAPVFQPDLAGAGLQACPVG